MRLSVDSNDRAYDPWLGRRACAYLDGRPVRDCVTADEEEGCVVAYAFDADGNRVVDESGLHVKETLHGDVRILIEDA